jgi:5-formyltetrahydrofolate cyclo-ligase
MSGVSRGTWALHVSVSPLHPSRTPYSDPLKPRDPIRRALRARRRALPAWERRRRDAALARQLTRHPVFLRSRHIALYLANDGEVDLGAVAREARARGKRVYLPVLSPTFHNRLWFAPYGESSPMVRNCFGILEPKVRWRATRPLWSLDLALVPLVGFDRQGNRLGMGGGFYDRSLAYLCRRSAWRKPQLVGVAYAFQECEQVAAEPWDVPLAAVVTDQQFIRS